MLARRTQLRRTPLKRFTRLAPRRRGGRRRSSRIYDEAFLAFCRTQICSVVEDWPDYPEKPTPCWGPIEADHDSRGRGFGQKSNDTGAIPMCKRHHEHRTGHTGTFKHVPRERIREWFDRAQVRIRTAWAQHVALEQQRAEAA